MRTHDYVERWHLPSQQAMPWSDDPVRPGFLVRLEDGSYLVAGSGGMKYPAEEMEFEIGVTRAHP